MGEADAAGTIRVLLADDDAPFLAALSPLIERQPELAVVGTAVDGLAAIELADELSPTLWSSTCTCRGSTACLPSRGCDTTIRACA